MKRPAKMPGPRIVIGLFLLFQIWLASQLGGSLPIMAILGLAVVLALFSHVSIPTNPNLKFWLACLLAVGLIGLIVFHHKAAEEEDFLRWRAWALALALYCIVWQTWELFEQRTGSWPPFFAALGVAAFVCLFAQATMARPPLAISSAIMAVFLTALVADASSGKAGSLANQPFSPRWLILPVVLAGVAVAANYIDMFFMRSVPLVQNWLESTVRANAGQTQGVRSYVRNATLTSIAFEKRTDPFAQALRVKCDKMPGYLRGSAYDLLDGVTWRRRRNRTEEGAAIGSRELFPQEQFPSDLNVAENARVYPLHDDARGPWIRLDITNDPRRGEMYFNPLEADHALTPGGRIVFDEHDILRGGIDRKSPYTFFVGATDTSTALPPEQQERLLRIPPELASIVRKVGTRIFTASTQSTRQKFAAVETYFNKEYKYSLDGFGVPKNKNPIAHFLESQPAAHCEFFASSAALLLRAEGVPSRYVTGYVVTSLSWGENAQWIGRNRDAHAWVEAYDADAKQWVIVEATPGVNVPKSLRMNAKTQDSAASTGADGVQNVIAENAWSFKNWLSFLRAAMLDQLLITLSLLLLLAGALWMAWQRIRKATAQGTTSTLERRKLRAMLQKLDSRLVRRRLRRERMETLHQFAARIRSQAMEDPWLKQAATWYEEYAQLVYGSVADLHALQQLAERVP